MEEISSKDLFEMLQEKLPQHEYLLFSWKGGGDDFHGYKLIMSKENGVEHDDHPEAFSSEIQESVNNSTILDDLSLEVYCVDQGWSEGLLLIALKPLTKDFYYDEPCVLEASSGFKGICVSGLNHEEISNSIDI